MSFLGFLNHWWNAPFLLLLGLVGLYFGLQLVGLAGHHDTEHDVSHEHDHDAEGGGLLGLLGAGHAPFLVVWMTLFIGTGFTGLALNRLIFLGFGGNYPPLGFAASFAAALVAGALCVRVGAKAASRLVDTGGHGAARKTQLQGRIGVVASALLDEKFGEVRLKDDGGNEMILHARLAPGEPSPKRGDSVVLVEYDEAKDLFVAAGLAAKQRGS